MFVSVIISVFTISTLWYLWRNRKLYIHSWNTPGPLALPIVGNLYMFIGLSADERVRIMQELPVKYPGLTKLWFGPILLHLTTKPEYVHKIVNHALERHYVIRLNPFPGSKGLLGAHTELWKRHRKAIMPAFNQRILNSFVSIFNEKADILCELLEQYVEQKGFDLQYLLCRCTLDIICETVMGIDMNVQETDSEYPTSFERLSELLIIRATHLSYHMNFIWKLSSAGRSFDQPFKICRDFTLSVLKKKIADLKISKDTVILDSDRKLSFLDSMLEMGGFTEEELLDEVDNIIAAGSETTATTMLFTSIVLGMHQDIQEKVFEEIMEFIGPERQVEPHDISKLEYTERVLKETLRIFPTAPVTLRTIKTDLQLDDKYTLPGGSTAIIFLLPIHRNPKYWPDPLKFDPDRFSPENVAERIQHVYLPFMTGPRNCIGARFAMMSMITILVHMVRKYKMFTDYKTLEEIEVAPHMSLKLLNGPKVWFERR